MRYSLTALLTLAAAALGAQDAEDLRWEREQLPLRFAQASPDLARRFERDWPALAGAGRERVYCVTAWHTETTPDGDSVSVADRAELMPDAGERNRVTAAEGCRSDAGEYLPTAHLHLGGDCSPSRADIRAVVARESFGLIVCGPRAVTGYVSEVYSLAQAGQRALLDRAATRVAATP